MMVSTESSANNSSISEDFPAPKVSQSFSNSRPLYSASAYSMNRTLNASRNEANLLNSSVVSIRTILDEPDNDFTYLDSTKIKTQKQQMQEQNSKLAIYIEKNKGLEDEIRKLIQEWREIEQQKDIKKSDIIQEEIQIKQKRELVNATKDDIVNLKIKARNLDLMNEDLESDIKAIDRKILYTKERIEAAKRGIIRCEKTMREDQNDIDEMIPRKDKLNEELEAQREKHKKKMIRLMSKRSDLSHTVTEFKPQEKDKSLSKDLAELRAQYIKDPFPAVAEIQAENRELNKKILLAEKKSARLDEQILILSRQIEEADDRCKEGNMEIKMLGLRIDATNEQIAAMRDYFVKEKARIGVGGIFEEFFPALASCFGLKPQVRF